MVATTQHSAVWYGRDGDSKEYTYPHRPAKYRGFLIYKRHAQEYHIVEEGEIVGMYAGPRGARNHVDMIADGEIKSSRYVRLKIEALYRDGVVLRQE